MLVLCQIRKMLEDESLNTKHQIADDYYVLNGNNDKVDFIVGIADERDFELIFDGTVSAFHPVAFKCLNFFSLEEVSANFDVYISNDIVISTEFTERMKKVYLYKCSVLPALVNQADYLYLHCGNVIDITNDGDCDFSILESIPVEKRLLFKPSEGSIFPLFHKTLLEKVFNNGELQFTKAIPVSQWTFEWMMS